MNLFRFTPRWSPISNLAGVDAEHVFTAVSGKSMTWKHAHARSGAPCNLAHFK